MTDKKTILIAESSKTLMKVLQKIFEEEDYKVLVSYDGFEAMKLILAEKPDCVIADVALTTINGIQLCSIIRKGYELADISFVLYSAEEDSSDFWANNTYADAFVFLSSENTKQLLAWVRNIVADNRVKISNFVEKQVGEYKENEIALCSARALEKTESYNYILKNILELSSYIEDIDELIEHLFQLVYKIVNYDSAIIILNDQPHKLYSTGLGNLDEKATERFLDICKNDYEDQLHSSNSIEYETYDYEGITAFAEKEKSYSSYLMFPIENTEIIGTIHLVSEKKRFFNYTMQSSVQMLTNSIGHILQSAIVRRRISISEQKLRSAFSKFVPEEIIDDLVSKKEETDNSSNNEKRKVAVLISDIRNFTTISEVNQPENVVGFLNGYFSLMVDIIKKHGGSIDKFIGDAIMAIFGAPISYVDNARRAVDAALEMVNALEEVDTSLINLPEGMHFDIGVGIHYGEVIVGNIGSKEKTDYTVIGDTVNLTSRIEGLTKQYGSKIMISQATKDEISDLYPIMQLDKVYVKGKKQGVQVYRVDTKPLPEDFSANYEKGLNLYMNGAWVLALSYFNKALEVIPNDKSANLMKKRCEEFIENPPEEWDGAIALTSK